MATLSPATITVLILIPLIIWRVYSRIRRMVGRQRPSKVRPWITLTVSADHGDAGPCGILHPSD